MKSSPTDLEAESNSEKKINFTSSSSSNLTDGLAFLTFLSSPISCSTSKDKVNYILIDLSSWVGILTILSFSTIFYTIFSLAIYTILGKRINCSNYFMNFSMISIWIAKFGLEFLNFLTSVRRISKLTLISFPKSLYLC